ncbi:hypothetical protein L596_021647 [Steinernema carpocapsae]|uniref:Secreted protein n=1 Tax=Steinernema carpocapsae TaxID=34508 RepID=A0A4V5ZZZ8_STECR|nr:hypothetical protein L596_021647 [Steinernema carpocapsae]
MIVKSLLLAALLVSTIMADSCLHCICLHESGCKPIGAGWTSARCPVATIRSSFPTTRTADRLDVVLEKASKPPGSAAPTTTTALPRVSRTTSTATRSSVLALDPVSACRVSTTEDPQDADIRALSDTGTSSAAAVDALKL